MSDDATLTFYLSIRYTSQAVPLHFYQGGCSNYDALAPAEAFVVLLKNPNKKHDFVVKIAPVLTWC